MNSKLEFADEHIIGFVQSVDTGIVFVKVDADEMLHKLQVNHLVAIDNVSGVKLIGLILKISITQANADEEHDVNDENKILNGNIKFSNYIKIGLIGSFHGKIGNKVNQFKRSIKQYPSINAKAYLISDENLTNFMGSIASIPKDSSFKLTLGKYSMDNNADAYIDGNKFFQRHAIIVGSTGSGKSYTVASLLEQISNTQNANAIVFDIHGEYDTLKDGNFAHYKIAGVDDVNNGLDIDKGVLYLPYWLLGAEALSSILVDRSDQNAPNQNMMISQLIINEKKKFLSINNQCEILNNFTIDSPIPFDLNEVINQLRLKDNEMVPKEKGDGTKQGDYFGKFTRLIARLESKIHDRRLGFMFKLPDSVMQMDWLEKIVNLLLLGDDKKGIKIIDFSEVPSDVLPLMVSMVAKITFTVQQWQEKNKRQPIALFCDEAQLYFPENNKSESASELSVGIFERIAKEGRKYGVGLVVITQRPFEVNRTILSQCNNIIALRLTNADDQNLVKKLLPDNLGGFSEFLPSLEIGEALVIGDASILPSRIIINEPKNKPSSATIAFWDKWNSEKEKNDLSYAVKNWRKQSYS